MAETSEALTPKALDRLVDDIVRDKLVDQICEILPPPIAVFKTGASSPTELKKIQIAELLAAHDAQVEARARLEALQEIQNCYRDEDVTEAIFEAFLERRIRESDR